MIYMLLLVALGLVLLIGLFQVFIPGPSDYERHAWPVRRQGGGGGASDETIPPTTEGHP
jgi:hypothetical protein